MVITWSGRLAEFRWSVYVKIQVDFEPLILRDRFWVGHIPFIRMEKFQFLSLFLVVQLAHPVVSRVLYFFCANLQHLLNYTISYHSRGVFFLLLQLQLRVFHWSSQGCKSPLVSKTLLSIIADLNNAVVWMVSIRPLTFNSVSPLSMTLATVPSAPTTIGFTITLILHSI